MDKIRIIIADPHDFYREGVRYVVSQHKDFDCVAIADNDLLALRLTSELTPDLLLVDICMVQKGIMDFLSSVKSASEGTHIVVLTHAQDHSDILRCFYGGVDGYLLKDIGKEQLLSSLRLILSGEQVLSPLVTQSITSLKHHDSSEDGLGSCPLKIRELEVIQLVSSGKTNKEIATELGISDHTVASHLVSIFRKLDAGSRAEAIVSCIKQGWITLK